MSQASAAANRMKILSLYKILLRESQKFSSYSFKMYTLRRVRDGFKEGKELTNPDKIQEKIKYAEKSLGTIKRQVTVGQLYSSEQLVIEKELK